MYIDIKTAQSTCRIIFVQRNIGGAKIVPVDAVVGLGDVVDAEACPRGATAHVEDDAVVAAAEEVRVDPVAARGNGWA